MDIASVLSAKPELVDLMYLLSDLAPKYERIGMSLNVPVFSLGLDPHSEYHQKNLGIILEWWINNGNNPKYHSPVTWENIIKVIEVFHYEKSKEMRAFLQKPDVYKRYRRNADPSKSSSFKLVLQPGNEDYANCAGTYTASREKIRERPIYTNKERFIFYSGSNWVITSKQYLDAIRNGATGGFYSSSDGNLHPGASSWLPRYIVKAV